MPDQDSKVFNPHKKFVGSIVPNWLMQRPEVSHAAKLLYGRLCQHASPPKDGGAMQCNPKVETLAEEMGMSVSAIKDALRELRGQTVRDEPSPRIPDGLIVCRRGGNGSPNRYEFRVHEWVEFRPESSKADSRKVVTEQTAEKSTPDSREVGRPYIDEKNQKRKSVGVSSFIPPTESECIAYAESVRGAQRADGKYFFNRHSAKGWKGIVDWKAQFRADFEIGWLVSKPTAENRKPQTDEERRALAASKRGY